MRRAVADDITPPPSQKSVPWSWWVHVILCLGLIGLTMLLYTPAVDLGWFHLDDTVYVVNNPLVHEASAENLSRILREPYFANYSPMHLLSYVADSEIGGVEPRVFHLSSHLWAGVCTAMVYVLGLCLLRHPLAALLSAVLFAVHPVHVEAVAWISSRKDLVAVAFALPSIACYVSYFRLRSSTRWLWYGTSLIFFLLAAAGKQSVIVLPVMLALWDWMSDPRPMRQAADRFAGPRIWLALLDKLPYIFIALFFALPTMDAQPATGHRVNPLIVGHATLVNLGLLSGLGHYVIYRLRPDPETWSLFTKMISLLPLLAAALPFVFVRWWRGLGGVLICWTLLAILPSMALSLVHPISDRYLFFPSVAFCLLLGVAIKWTIDKGRLHRWWCLGLTGLLIALWTTRTLGYLGEWNDPRSVWHAAISKSKDINVWQYLGTHYQEQADSLDAGPPQGSTLLELAELHWPDDSRLQQLVAEWAAGQSGAVSQAFQVSLRARAWEIFETAVGLKRSQVTPNLFFRRGKLKVDTGDAEAARPEFEKALAEAAQHTDQGIRDELFVRSHHALGVIAWRLREYDVGLGHLRQAEARQSECGVMYIPDLATHRARLERLADG